jgi:peptidoglycan-associated lipoprotein
MHRWVMVVPVVAIALGGTTACATKKFVRGQVGEVDTKVETLSGTLEQNQERTRQNEARIGEVDQKAEAANRSASEAAAAARAADARITEESTRTTRIDTAMKRLIYEVTLTEDQGGFKFGQAKVPDDVKSEVDKLVEQLKTDPKGAFIEIEGHTDNVGGKGFNERLGMLRAEEVKRYLYEQHQVPLHKMNVISYGEDKPIAPNKTRDGRKQNRRVVIRVLT